jgi:hypothetical protein
VGGVPGAGRAQAQGKEGVENDKEDMKEERHHIERRKYIRLQSVFPVEFKLLSKDGKREVTDFMQGFTADISKGGILLRAGRIKADVAKRIQKGEGDLLLHINIPYGRDPIAARAGVAWMTTVKEHEKDLCLIGLSFRDISDKNRKRLVGYTMSLYRTPKLTMAALFLMLFTIGVGRIEEIGLRRENAILVGSLQGVLKEKSEITELLEETGTERLDLLARLEKQREEITNIEKERKRLISEEERLRKEVMDREVLKIELDKTRNVKSVLESQAKRLAQERIKLLDRLGEIKQREDERTEELERIESARKALERKTLDNMYSWLRVHQNRKTDLVASYEGDRALNDIAFTYDQSLAAQTFLLYGDNERARSMLDFFKRRSEEEEMGFLNAYEVNSGAATEYKAHVGPNIWLGIALMQYMHRTGDERYTGLAKNIADWVISIQEEDPEGGIRGGPGVTWYSTEHNLDAYAYFSMLADKTGEKKYGDAAALTLKWIKEHAFSQNGRIYRGKGDSTIATDTFSWAIAALGPRTLIESGMDPDAIMKFAEDNCRVTVNFKRPDGSTVKVTGFDFAKHQHLPRGGVVSSEWTAQMVVSFRIMSDFYLAIGDYDKASLYQEKYNFYLSELEKMVISSPSRLGQGAGCLPYATLDNVDTGHGWRTPKGRNTGSVSGTAYGIFAIKGFNPMKLE